MHLLKGDAPGTQRYTFGTENRLKLGLFGANCSSGRAATKVPERWAADWDETARVTQLADAAGMDFMLPIGRWRGFGGETDFQSHTFETITWATGLLAQTQRLSVFCTIHAPLIGPIFAAKQFVTADHIGHGRLGVNVVCGWNQDEFEMFGVEQRDHERRYAYGRAWLDVIKRLWSDDEPFDVDNEFFHLHKVVGNPKPFGNTRPVLMNAGASPIGREFGITNCDMIFVPLIDLESGARTVLECESRARELGKDIRVATAGFVVCRPTRREAEEFLHYYAEENADWEAVDYLMALNGLHSRSYPPEHFKRFRSRWAAGHGGFPVVGSPDDVAGTLAAISDAGFYGFCFSLVNYLTEFPYFRDEVLPRLAARGVRLAV